MVILSKAARIIRLKAQVLIFSSLAFFASCNEDMPTVRDPCDFIQSNNEISPDTSTSTCNECFFRFSFQGRLYEFNDDIIITWNQCSGEKCTDTNANDLFEFKLKSLQRSSDLFSALNEQRALLTADSLLLTDFTFFQPSFQLKDRCGEEYQVAKNTNSFFPDLSISTLTGINVYNYFVIDDTRYSTSYLISGTFSTQVLIGGKSESIGGSYALLYAITEPF